MQARTGLLSIVWSSIHIIRVTSLSEARRVLQGRREVSQGLGFYSASCIKICCAWNFGGARLLMMAGGQELRNLGRLPTCKAQVTAVRWCVVVAVETGSLEGQWQVVASTRPSARSCIVAKAYSPQPHQHIASLPACSRSLLTSIPRSRPRFLVRALTERFGPSRIFLS